MRLITPIATLIRYRLLEKFEVTIKESELAKLAGLRTEWATYKTMLQEAGFKLQKSKNDFKDELTAALASFNNQVRSPLMMAN